MHHTIYQMHGYADRHEYFKSLADSYCTDVTTVKCRTLSVLLRILAGYQDR